jgi:hypothetical protein
VRYAPRRLAFAATGSHRANGNHWLARGEHRGIHVESGEGHALALDILAMTVNVIEAYIGICEHDLVDLVLFYKVIEFFFGVNTNTIGILRPGERSRIAPIVDVRNLCSRKCDDIEIRIVAVTTVENMKIAARGPHDDYLPTHLFLPRQGSGQHQACTQGYFSAASTEIRVYELTGCATNVQKTYETTRIQYPPQPRLPDFPRPKRFRLLLE